MKEASCLVVRYLLQWVLSKVAFQRPCVQRLALERLVLFRFATEQPFVDVVAGTYVATDDAVTGEVVADDDAMARLDGDVEGALGQVLVHEGIVVVVAAAAAAVAGMDHPFGQPWRKSPSLLDDLEQRVVLAPEQSEEPRPGLEEKESVQAVVHGHSWRQNLSLLDVRGQQRLVPLVEEPVQEQEQQGRVLLVLEERRLAVATAP